MVECSVGLVNSVSNILLNKRLLPHSALNISVKIGDTTAFDGSFSTYFLKSFRGKSALNQDVVGSIVVEIVPFTTPQAVPYGGYRTMR